MTTYFNIALIILSVSLVVALMFQTGGGGLGGIFGQADTVYRSRRGLERTLFRFTIILAVLFVVISIVSVIWRK
jgi:preprotein translocase subunit SecG